MGLIRRSKECRGNLSGQNVGGTQLKAAVGLREVCHGSPRRHDVLLRGCVPSQPACTGCLALPSERRVVGKPFVRFGGGKAGDQILILCLPGLGAPCVYMGSCRFSFPEVALADVGHAAVRGTTQHPIPPSLSVHPSTAPPYCKCGDLLLPGAGRGSDEFSGKVLGHCSGRKGLSKEILQNPLMPWKLPQWASALL